MSYIQKTRAAEAFLTGRSIAKDDVLSLDVAQSPVHIQIFGKKLPGVTWNAKRVGDNDHHHADIVQDGVALRLVTVLPAEVPA